MSASYNVAVIGATGAVGEEMFKVLEQRAFPVKNIRALASARSKGTTVSFAGQSIVVEDTNHTSLEGIDIALFSAGSSVSREFAPRLAQLGTVSIDNSAAFRMEPDVPLVVPEVNPDAVELHHGIIANPNCSTIQLVVALKPLHEQATITRLVVATYQAVSGTGRDALAELHRQTQQMLNGEDITPEVYPHQIAFNLLPDIGTFLPSGYTTEEMKLLHETRKIMGAPDIRVTATCVRVPVNVGHSEAVTMETKSPLTPDEARELLRQAPGVVVQDDPSRAVYPLPLEAAGTDPVYVGRIRQDSSCRNSLSFWVVSDNLRKGAALNAVQIAELLVEKKLV